MSSLQLPDNPTLADYQQYVRDMETERGFTKEQILHVFTLLVEEVGELAKVIRKNDDVLQIDSAKHYEIDPTGEVADVFMMLISVANRMDIDIEQAFRDKEEKNKLRTWSL